MLRNPIIGQYVEALTDPFRIFRTLGEVVPERDAYGEPLFWSGNYSVIFKVRCADGKYYALKCYTRLPRHAAAVYASLGGGTFLIWCRPVSCRTRFICASTRAEELIIR